MIATGEARTPSARLEEEAKEILPYSLVWALIHLEFGEEDPVGTKTAPSTASPQQGVPGERDNASGHR